MDGDVRSLCPDTDSDLSAEIAKLLRQEFGSRITLLHVTDDPAGGETFLEEWATGHRVDDAELRVETGDIGKAISRAAEDATLVLAGASERGLLSRLLRRSPIVDLFDDVDCSVILAERAHKRGFIKRLLGR